MRQNLRPGCSAFRICSAADSNRFATDCMVMAMFEMASLSVELAIGLIGVLSLWLGVVALGEASVAVEPSLAAEYIDAQIASVLMQMGAGASPERVREQARLAFRVLFSPRT